jgi:hypothetical protein
MHPYSTLNTNYDGQCMAILTRGGHGLVRGGFWPFWQPDPSPSDLENTTRYPDSIHQIHRVSGRAGRVGSYAHGSSQNWGFSHKLISSISSSSSHPHHNVISEIHSQLISLRFGA